MEFHHRYRLGTKQHFPPNYSRRCSCVGACRRERRAFVTTDKLLAGPPDKVSASICTEKSRHLDAIALLRTYD